MGSLPASPPSSYAHTSIRGFDPDAFAEIIRGGAFDHHTLGGGLVSADLESWESGGVSIDRGHYGFATLVEGEFPPDALCFGLVESPGETRINGQRVRSQHVQIYTEGAEVLYRATANTRWASLQVSRTRLQEHAVERTGRSLELPTSGMVDRVLDPRAVNRVRARLERALYDARTGRERNAEGHADRILDQLIAALRGDDPKAMQEFAERRTATIRRALRWMRAHTSCQYDSNRLCQALGMPERTLQSHFKNGLGMTPANAHRQIRLHRAHRELLQTHPDAPHAVTVAATNHGFEHLGRFAGEYRALFDELPSETLRRPLSKMATGLARSLGSPP